MKLLATTTTDMITEPITEPSAEDAEWTDEQQKAYFDAMQRGESGARLARSAGVPVPRGSSPPVVMPPPPVQSTGSWGSSANLIRGASQQDIDMAHMERSLANVPIAQAQAAIAAATQYQAQRGYQQDIQNGKDPGEALARWAPMMFGKTPAAMGGAASLIKATRPEPKYEFAPGDVTAGRPAAWVQQGGRGKPITIPGSAIPPGPIEDLIQEEIMPGVMIIRDPKKGGFKIATGDRGLSKDQKLKLSSRYQSITKQMENMDPTSPELPRLRIMADTIFKEMMKGYTGESEDSEDGTEPEPSPVTPPKKKGAFGNWLPDTSPTKRYRWNPKTGKPEPK
jgi:hypothetical protein